ncbi:hypothetical protein Q7C36_012289 [Tachysurus vachellii]|uniref:Uncharacterized protein n=1 Tax=Tachysurus vachellii TaxID=175792 RepID=A0AA88MLX3_TACVA|nr:hypothetical protein Q7C36_012289 [Tachysurus vachellii]
MRPGVECGVGQDLAQGVEIPSGETCKVQGGLEVEVALQPQINFPFNSPVTVVTVDWEKSLSSSCLS